MNQLRRLLWSYRASNNIKPGTLPLLKIRAYAYAGGLQPKDLLMTDLDNFVRLAGASARNVRDGDLAAGMDPVWLTAEENWQAFSGAVLRAPTAELKALFMEGWGEVDR